MNAFNQYLTGNIKPVKTNLCRRSNMKRFNLITTVIFAVLFSLMATTSAIASTLTETKADGLIGEQANGYLGLVSSNAPADVKALVADVNAKRKAAYQKIAQQQGTSLEEVEKVGGNTAIEKTLPGNYVQDANGVWRRK
jgi:uncharacterized protein YdbL (DUF1318 family)